MPRGDPANKWMVPGPAAYGTVGFYRDSSGFVHLTGEPLACGAAPQVMFTLPPGYRPADRDFFNAFLGRDTLVARVFVEPEGYVLNNANPNDQISLGQISFRCAPSGQDGCP